METLLIPSKFVIRAYLTQRQKEHSPPPSIEEIRRQLGWNLAPQNQPHA
jgi:hypothetical protein